MDLPESQPDLAFGFFCTENTEKTRLFLYSAEPESEIAINSTYLNSTFATLPDYLHH